VIFNRKNKQLLNVLLESKKFIKKSDYENAEVLIESNECVLALELICEQVYEYDKKLPLVLIEKISTLGEYYDVDKRIIGLINRK